MEAKIRHLEMIQRAIDGASGNSLRIKGIAMILFAGTIAFLLRDGESTSTIPFTLAIILFITVVILGLLDYYFIRRADLFRILYNRVRELSENDIDFSMDAERFGEELSNSYNMNLPVPIAVTFAFYACASLSVISAALP